MFLARVLGNVVATRKDAGLCGVPLLVIQPRLADGTSVGRPLVATDSVGAGPGEDLGPGVVTIP